MNSEVKLAHYATIPRWVTCEEVIRQVTPESKTVRGDSKSDNIVFRRSRSQDVAIECKAGDRTASRSIKKSNGAVLFK